MPNHNNYGGLYGQFKGKLWSLQVSFDQGEQGYIELKTALVGIVLSHAFSEVAWVNASYTQNNKNFGDAPDQGPMGIRVPAIPERRLQLNMQGGNYVVIEQKGNDVSINKLTPLERDCLTYQEGGKVFDDWNARFLDDSDAEVYRTGAMNILDIAPQIMIRNLGYNPR